MDPNQHQRGSYPPPTSQHNYGSYPPPPQAQQYQQFSQIPQYSNLPHSSNGYSSHPVPVPQSNNYAPSSSMPLSSPHLPSTNYPQPSSAVSMSPHHYSAPPYQQSQSYQSQQQPYPQPPPSPNQSEPNEDEEQVRRSIPGPGPEMHEFDGKKYALVVVQEPIRARMCGFGDKDRRPISTPPIVKAVITEANTGEEIDYKNSDMELSHFVCQVHIYDKHGANEKSIVRTSAGQQIISASLASGFPTTVVSPGPIRSAPRLPTSDPVYRKLYGTGESLDTNPSPTQAGQYSQRNYGSGPYAYPGSSSNGLFPHALGPPSFPPSATNGYTPVPTPYTSSRSNLPQASGHQVGAGPNQPPTPPLAKNEDAPAGPGFSRNLIGSHSTSGQLLEDQNKKLGIFFVFSDLSVRSEDWFRLKFSLFNVGEVTTNMSNEEIFRIAEDNNTAPLSGSNFDATKNGTKRLDGLKAGLIAKSAPCLATVFSQAFKVYSAKKFPGVAESTELSRIFAHQGVKISIRKDDKNGKRKRDDSDDGGDLGGPDSPID